MNDPSPVRAPSDDELVAMLGEALRRVEPVPAHVDEGARAAFSWRDVDTELAELAFDSLTASSGVRGEENNRQLTFRSPGVEIELMLTGNGTNRLIGQLVPPQESQVELISGDDRYETTADRHGRFAFDGPLTGPARLIVHGDGGDAPVRTEWIVL